MMAAILENLFWISRKPHGWQIKLKTYDAATG